MFVDQRSDLLWLVLVKGFLRGINFYGAFEGWKLLETQKDIIKIVEK